MSNFKIKLTLTEDMLGTLPGDSEVYRNYIATKAPDPTTIEDEIKAITENKSQEEAIDDVMEKGVTVFARNKDGEPCVYDYLIKGFFKNACKAMREVSDSESKGLTSYKTKIDNLIFVSPRMIPIDYKDLGEISICERPLRASTAQGERIALAASESIPAGSTLEFEVKALDKKFDKYITEWLDYGAFNGLGQWHNSGKGRFTYEVVE